MAKPQAHYVNPGSINNFNDYQKAILRIYEKPDREFRQFSAMSRDYANFENLYFAKRFFAHSLVHFLMSNLAAMENADHVINHLNANGFEHVTIERTDSPHNHHKNVWIITGKISYMRE